MISKKLTSLDHDITYIEDKLLWQVLGVSPHNPADTWIYEAILVATDVDRNDLWQAEVPYQPWVDKGCNVASAGRIDVDAHVQVLRDQEVIDCLDILILASIGGANDGADADCVLVYQVYALLGVDNVAVGSAVHVLCHIPISSSQFVTPLIIWGSNVPSPQHQSTELPSPSTPVRPSS